MMRSKLHARRRQPRLISSIVALLTVFLVVNMEILKWKIADFVLHDEKFDSLRNNFLSKYHLLPPIPNKELTVVQPARRLVNNMEEMESFPVASFQFGFFNSLYSKPTQEEYQGLLCQTKAYFLQLMQRKLGGGDSSIYVNLYSANWMYSPELPKPVFHTVVVHATFEDGTPIPTEEVNQAVRASDMAEYIEHFVWAAEPHLDGTFFDTQTARLEVGVANQRGYTHEQDEVGGITLQSSVNCPANGYYEATFNYGFFPGHATKPEQGEIEALVPLTAAFLQHKLQETYDVRKVHVELALMGWVFNDQTDPDMPLTITMRMLATFEYGGDVIPLDYVKEKLAHDEETKETIMQDYIKMAVWEVPPFKESTFWDVNRVRMNSKVFRFSIDANRDREVAEGGPAYGNGDGYGSQSGMGRPDGMGSGRPEDEEGEGGAPDGAAGHRAGEFGLGNLVGGGDGNGNETTRHPRDPSRSAIFTLGLGPINVSPENCRDFLKSANANLDRFLTQKEYVTFTNSMANETYIGFPFVALPDKIQGVFESMSLKNEDNEEVIDLLGAFRPDISQEDLNLLEDTRADKICSFFKTTLNNAIANGPVESTKINSTIEFYLENESEDPDNPTDPNMGALDTAFQNLVGNNVGPAIEEAVGEGMRMRERRKHRGLSKRALALQVLRRLQDSSAYAPADSAKVNNVEETECRGGARDGTTCYNAEAGVEVYLKGDNAADVAPQAAVKTEQMLEDAVVSGDFQKEIDDIDPSWKVSSMYMPTTMPSPAPSLAPSVAPPPSKPATEAPKEDKGFVGAAGAGVATAAAGSVLLMIALQCGREFLVDLMIRMCKICCSWFRRYDEEEESEYDSDYDSENADKDHTGTDGDEDQGGFNSRRYQDIELDGRDEEEEDDEEDDSSDEDEDEEDSDEDGSEDEGESEEYSSDDEDEDESEEDGSEDEGASEEETDLDSAAPAPAPFAVSGGDVSQEQGLDDDSEEGSEEETTADESDVDRGGIGGEEEEEDSSEEEDDADDEGDSDSEEEKDETAPDTGASKNDEGDSEDDEENEVSEEEAGDIDQSAVERGGIGEDEASDAGGKADPAAETTEPEASETAAQVDDTEEGEENEEVDEDANASDNSDESDPTDAQHEPTGDQSEAEADTSANPDESAHSDDGGETDETDEQKEGQGDDAEENASNAGTVAGEEDTGAPADQAADEPTGDQSEVDADASANPDASTHSDAGEEATEASADHKKDEQAGDQSEADASANPDASAHTDAGEEATEASADHRED